MVYLQMDLSQKRLLQEKFIRFTQQHMMADPKNLFSIEKKFKSA
jgi:hypothetical protein